jgi:23S rRNA-intervening sequence protein
MKDFRNLKVGGKAHLLTLALYKVIASFPRDETYGLASRIRRAASSVLPISPKVAAGMVTPNWLASALSPEVLPPNWSINSCSPEFEFDSTQGLRKPVRADCRNKAHAHRLGSEAERCSLKAVRARPAESSSLVAASGRARTNKVPIPASLFRGSSSWLSAGGDRGHQRFVPKP